MNKFKMITLVSVIALSMQVQAKQYWTPSECETAITWNVIPEDFGHMDHMEMSGKRVSAVMRYGVNPDGSFYLERGMVWPLLRTVPNDTHASLMRKIKYDPFAQMTIAERPMKETVKSITIDGTIKVVSELNNGWLQAKREYAASTELPALIERYTLVNKFNEPLYLVFAQGKLEFINAEWRGVEGKYRIAASSDAPASLILQPGDSLVFGGTVAATKLVDAEINPDYDTEFINRKALVSQLQQNLILETPNPVLDRMFAFSKIRAAESIYATKGGPMHGPGGEAYYAAIWANDQAEYANPFFPYLGYEYANRSAENSFYHFSRYMNDNYKAIPSSIIAEGDSYWNGAKDRGDAAMIAYGASRYALAYGNKDTAKTLWPLIEWCLEYCDRKKNSEGVIASDSDELETRFPAGDANLCTSSLYYDALISASLLAKELGMSKQQIAKYDIQAKELKKSINTYFNGPIEGFDTYIYYKGNDLLRSWICIPLTMGIYDKAPATVDALFSPRLWTENGMVSQAGHHVYWDRSTLYGLRGVCQAGYIDRALPYIESYSSTRLLGDHVPYAIEAWPEGNQRHLSAESALYARIFTEGVFGIRPTGLKSFSLTPQLPDSWDKMALRNVCAFNSKFDIEVYAIDNNRIRVKILNNGKTIQNKIIAKGKTLAVRL